MKKLVLLLIVLSVICTTYAQTDYSVPTPTLEQKYNMTNMLMNNNILGLMFVAKNGGIVPEELGRKVGDLAIPYWDENGGYEPFINFLLYSWACTSEGVQIIEQSDEKLIVVISSMYKPIEEQGVLFGASIEDYTEYFNAMLKVIAVHYDRSIEMKWGEEGFRIVIDL